MRNVLLCSVIIYLSTYVARGAEVNSPDGDGCIPHKDEKIVKLLSITRDLQDKVDSFSKQTADIVETIDDLRNILSAQSTTLTTQGSQLRDLQENPVPIGFVYVQLSGQPEPQNVWTAVRWAEITSTYAGLFFRAAGGNAAAFRSTQAENSPRLNGVNRRNLSTTVNHIWPIPLGNWSAVISTGSVSDDRHSGLQFSLSSVEVRPRNQAVRIRRRIK